MYMPRPAGLEHPAGVRHEKSEGGGGLNKYFLTGYYRPFNILVFGKSINILIKPYVLGIS